MKKDKERRFTFLGLIFFLILVFTLVYYLGKIFDAGYVEYFHKAMQTVQSLWSYFLANTTAGRFLVTYRTPITKYGLATAGIIFIIYFVITFFTKRKYRIWFRPFVLFSFLLCFFIVFIVVYNFPTIAKFPVFSAIYFILYRLIVATGIVVLDLIARFNETYYRYGMQFLDKYQFLIANLATFYVIWLLIFKLANYFYELQLLGNDRKSATIGGGDEKYRLFREVHTKALSIDRGIPKHIHFFTNQDKSINAVAYGHNRICVNAGTWALNDEALIQAFIAHEMGHLAHKDTDALQLSTVCLNFLLFIVLVPLNVTGWIVSWSCGFLPSVLGTFINGFFGNWLQDKCQDGIRNIFRMTERLARVLGGRRDETRADEFAAQCGYGEALARFFERAPDAGGGFDEHPRNEKRAANIRKAMSKLQK